MCKHVKSLRSAELEQTVLAATTRRLFGCVCVCVLCATRVFKELFFVDFPWLYPNLISDLGFTNFVRGYHESYGYQGLSQYHESPLLVTVTIINGYHSY